MQNQLIRLANHDSLTGIYNRRAFFEFATARCQGAKLDEPISIILGDIDNFKMVNDIFGHAVGDEAIRLVAKLISIDGAIVGRIGGEEFAILLPSQTETEAAETINAIRMTVEEARIQTDKNPLRVTCSFGVSQWQEGDDIDTVLGRSDIAMYKAKKTGRNRVVIADELCAETSAPEHSILRGKNRA